jgi:hypothetical protein
MYRYRTSAWIWKNSSFLVEKVRILFILNTAHSFLKNFGTELNFILAAVRTWNLTTLVQISCTPNSSTICAPERPSRGSTLS